MRKYATRIAIDIECDDIADINYSVVKRGIENKNDQDLIYTCREKIKTI